MDEADAFAARCRTEGGGGVEVVGERAARWRGDEIVMDEAGSESE